LDQVGLLDESFHFYSEDYDWFKRLSDAAWQVLFCPEAQVLHHWGASSGKRSDWALSQLYRSKRLYFRKHNGRSAETVLRAGLAVRFATKSLVAIAVWPLHQQEASLRWRQQVKLIGEQLRPLTEYTA
jgi:GT2 family glycosyltransferase